MVLQAITTLQDAGVEPDIWKIEGLDYRDDCEKVVDTATRGGRHEVGCIVLGRAADESKVATWLEIAASVPGFIGFAVGRTTFWNAIADYVANKATREEAVSRIAQRYADWVAIFERTHRSQANVV
jgi:myo-inositol catabolism protein IolC